MHIARDVAYFCAYLKLQMHSFFAHKVVVVTGGTEGIGKALVIQLLAQGASVATCGRNKEKLYALQQTYPTLFCMQADVSQMEDCNNFILETIKKFGGIDVLINNAGISMRALLADADVSIFKTVMDINYFGTVYCTKFALASIVKRRGSIVGVSSIAGFRGLPGRTGYSASKFAVNGFLEALRTELSGDGVNVMWVCPGFTKSNIRNAALNAKAESHGETPMDEDSLMSAEACAGHILTAIQKRKRSLVLTFTGKRTVFMNKFFPDWTDKLTRKFFFKNDKLVK